MSEQPADLGTLDEEIVRAEPAWGRLLSGVGRVPIDRTEEPGVTGDWSLKTLLGHIAFWDQFEIEHIANRHELGEIDWQPINAAHERAVEGRTYADVLAEMKETHERLMAHVGTLAKTAADRTRCRGQHIHALRCEFARQPLGE